MGFLDALMQLEREGPPRERRTSRGSLFKEDQEFSPSTVATLAFLPESDEERSMDLMDALMNVEKGG